MKGAVVLFEKNGVLIRTQYLSRKTVQWLEEEKPVAELLSEGYEIVSTNKIQQALQKLEALRERVCYGYKAGNTDMLEIITILRDY